MAQTFYFYDLETSGFNPREARIMQFAGQRTDMDLKPIGEPHNVLIKMTDDVVPSPDAILVTGITPQKTIAEGITEAEFLQLFSQEISQPETIFVGFNSIRFDDEFMRFLQYRNYYDAYEWQYKDKRSRWDLLDVVRMTRALRPDGIEWPFATDGKPANRLELLTSVNKIAHEGAHDALSDVRATISLAELLKSKQPKLFDYLLKLRDKKHVAELVSGGKPFVYTSGKYDNEYEKTTVVGLLAEHPEQAAALVFDLRFDPNDFAKLTPTELADAWYRRRDEEGMHLPVKTLKYNRCPAIAPLSVLDDESQERLAIDLTTIQRHYKNLHISNLSKNILLALELLDKQRQTKLLESESEVDGALYDSFVGNTDKQKMRTIQTANTSELVQLKPNFTDQRLQALFPLYKARNFPKLLTDDERVTWERFRERKLLGGKQSSQLAQYFKRLAELDTDKTLSGEKRYLLEELQLYGQSIMPNVED